ncbi:MAG: glycosyltransferase 87 family protein [Candidatus Hodarchaeota archaeon]
MRNTGNDNSRIRSITERLNRFSVEVSLLFSGILLFVLFESLIYLTKLDRSNPFFILGFFFPFTAFLLITFLIRHIYDINTNSNFFLLIIFIFATIFQIVILLTEVTLSDDIYRFFEEGKAITHGINPYITPIEDFPSYPKDPYIDQVNNANVTSPYPPLALLLFAFLYLIYPNPIIYRLFFSVGFLISILFFNRIISHKNKWKLIIYAWNPLLHLETANGSHFEAIVVLLVLMSLLSLKSKQHEISGFFLILGFLLKYYPIFLVFPFWKQLGRRGLTVIFTGVFLYALFVVLNPFLIHGLLVYSNEWYFNASIFWLVYELLGNFFLSKILVGIVFTILLSIIAVKTQVDITTSYRYAIFVIGSFLLLQPVFHPWYIFWLFPFLIIDNRMNLSWIFLSGTLILSYHVYILYDTIGIWVESNLLRMIEYIPFFGLLIFEIWDLRRINQEYSTFKFSIISKKVNFSSLKKIIGVRRNDRHETS